MASNTKKHQDFVNEPMGNKPVTAVPGIGRAGGESLKAGGIDKVLQVLSYNFRLIESHPRIKSIEELCMKNNFKRF